MSERLLRESGVPLTLSARIAPVSENVDDALTDLSTDLLPETRDVVSRSWPAANQNTAIKFNLRG